MSPPLAVTEDTPADMLTGSMDLDVVLPSGQIVRMSVQRSTPMMDLLVQVTTAHRLSPGNYSLQPMGERGALPYKPSTPIGALDTFTVRIVLKKSNSLKKAPPTPQILPTTFRLQVHLPRSQLFVTRVAPEVTIGDVLNIVCREKALDIQKYELRKTGNLGLHVTHQQSLGEINTQELTLVLKGSDVIRQLSSADIIQVKQSNNRQNSVCDSSLSSGSLGSRSVSPVTMSAPPQVPQRKKRRPAPKPPVQDVQTRTVLISHSRESSDSSGYHEPSTLSESPTHGVPASSGMAGRNSQSLSNLTSLPSGRLRSSVSITSLSSNGTGSKKKRAPPPPSSFISKPNTILRSSTLPADTRHKTSSKVDIPLPPVELAPSPPGSPEVASKLLTHRPYPSTDEETATTGKYQSAMLDNSHTRERIGDKDVDSSLTKRHNNSSNGHIRPWSLLIEESRKANRSTEDDPSVLRKTTMVRQDAIQVTSPVKEQPPEKPPDGPKPLPRSAAFINTVFFGGPRNPQAAPRSLSLDNVGSIDMRGKPPIFEKPKHLRSSLQSNPTVASKPPLSKLPSFDSLPKDIVDHYMRNHHEHFSYQSWNHREAVSDNHGTMMKEKCEDEDFGKTETVNFSETSGISEEHDSLNVDWQYQLPPPPHHFQDSSSPEVTEFGTVSLASDVFATSRLEVSDKLQPRLNGIHEETETDSKDVPEMKEERREEKLKDRKVEKRSVTEDEKRTNCENKVSAKTGEHIIVKGFDSVQKSGYRKQRVIKGQQSEDHVVLLNKKEVMAELTNVLDRNKLQERSQSYSSLHMMPDEHYLKKSHTLSHSQSFLNPPSLSNFSISSYESDQRYASSTEDLDDGFRKPIKPALKAKSSVRRSDSMTIKRSTLNTEALQQEFLQFLQEKKLTDAGLALEDIGVLPAPEIQSEIKPPPVVEPSVGETVSSTRITVNNVAPVREETEPIKPTEPVKIIEEALTPPLEVTEEHKREVAPEVQVVTINNVVPPPSRETPAIPQPISVNLNTQTFEDTKEKKKEPLAEANQKRFVYRPPSVSMGTWGERPKTTVVIRDDDYTTHDNLVDKKPFEPKMYISESPKKVVDKRHVIAVKKPSNYELFSALPKRKELTATNIFLEDESQKEPSRLPVVCAVELKKEYRVEPDLIMDLENGVKIPNEEEKQYNNVPKTSSVYLVPKTTPWGSTVTNTKVPIGPRPNLMPVVKGFREPLQNGVVPKSVTVIQRQESMPSRIEDFEKKRVVDVKNVQVVDIPPPPPIGLINLKPVGNRPIKIKSIEDPRDQLLDQIRSFGGTNTLRKTVQ